MAITPLPTPPSRQDPANFSDRADAFLGALPTFTTEANALATDVNAKQVTASAAAITAASAASAAVASEVNISALANFKGTWSSLTGALNKPASVFHNGAYWALLNSLADVTTSQPGVSADWQVAGGAFPVVAINSNTTASPWTTYLIYGNCTLTLPAISGNGKQVGVIVLNGVTSAVIARSGTDKIRNVNENMNVDNSPFSAILTDTGATYGWV